MKSANRDRVEGKLHEIKGAVKEAAGKLVDSPELQAEGIIEKTAGKVQERVGQLKK